MLTLLFFIKENALALEQLSGSDFENDGESDGEDEVQEDQDEHFDENKEIDSDGNLVEHENNQYEEGSEEESEEGSEEGSEEDIFELENGFKVASGDTENDSNKTGRDTEKEEIVQKDLGNTVVKTENENATHTNAENEQKIAQPIPKVSYDFSSLYFDSILHLFFFIFKQSISLLGRLNNLNRGGIKFFLNVFFLLI